MRVDKASVAITGVSTKDLFTVTGGRVLVRQLIGEVTVAIQNQANAATPEIISEPKLEAAPETVQAEPKAPIKKGKK